MTSNNERPELPARVTLNFREDGLMFYGLDDGPWGIAVDDEVKTVRAALESLYAKTKSMKVGF